MILFHNAKKYLKKSLMWLAARWCVRSFVHALPLFVCRVLISVPGLGTIAVARILANESCAGWFADTPGKAVDLVPGLVTRVPEAIETARSLLPFVPQGSCSILEHCHVIKGGDLDFTGKKVALMAHWDPDNRVDPFVSHYLRGLQQAGFATILTSAAPLEASEEDLAYADAALYRTCGGYDFTSWKGALEIFPSLRRAAELVLTNDSVFAPLADIGQMHKVMDAVPCDFWGLMESRDQFPAMPSFYMVFREKPLRHSCFDAFWNSVDTVADKDIVVRRYEQSQALWFALHGLVPGAYIHWGMTPWLKGGPAYVCWKQLVRLFGVPCVKRAVVNGDVWWADATGWEQLVTDSGYPLPLIHNFLARYRKERVYGDE